MKQILIDNALISWKSEIFKDKVKWRNPPGRQCEDH